MNIGQQTRALEDTRSREAVGGWRIPGRRLQALFVLGCEAQSSGGWNKKAPSEVHNQGQLLRRTRAKWQHDYLKAPVAYNHISEPRECQRTPTQGKEVDLDEY